MGAELCRAGPLRDAGLRRLRPVLAARRLARRPLEPLRHDVGVLRRHRHRVDRHRVRHDAAPDRDPAVRRRRPRRDLSPRRPRHGRRERQGIRHRPGHRHQRRVGQSRRRQRRADHRLLHRQWRLARGLRSAGPRLDRDRRRLFLFSRPDMAAEQAAKAAKRAAAPRQPSRPRAAPPTPTSDCANCCCACRSSSSSPPRFRASSSSRRRSRCPRCSTSVSAASPARPP